MPACYIGTSSITGTIYCQCAGQCTGTTLSYTAPAGVQYSVVTISESASVSAVGHASGCSFHGGCIRGAGVTVEGTASGTPCEKPQRGTTTSNKTTVMLKPGNTFSFQPIFSFNNAGISCARTTGTYVGVMSVYEVC